MSIPTRKKYSWSEKVKKCSSCNNYASQPIWGHVNCSLHRLCSGIDRFEPNNCSDCGKQCELFNTLAPEERSPFLKELKELCIKTRLHKLRKNIYWQYANEVSAF